MWELPHDECDSHQHSVIAINLFYSATGSFYVQFYYSNNFIKHHLIDSIIDRVDSQCISLECRHPTSETKLLENSWRLRLLIIIYTSAIDHKFISANIFPHLIESLFS